jgi:hypothetical protein
MINLVELTGSAKQIEWALKLQSYVVNEINSVIESIDFSEKQISSVEKMKIELENNSSKFWIDSFGEGKTSGKLFEYLNNKMIAGRRIASAINSKNGVM